MSDSEKKEFSLPHAHSTMSHVKVIFRPNIPCYRFFVNVENHFPASWFFMLWGKEKKIIKIDFHLRRHVFMGQT